MAEKKSTSKKAPVKKVSAKVDPAPVKRNPLKLARAYKKPFKRPRKG